MRKYRGQVPLTTRVLDDLRETGPGTSEEVAICMGEVPREVNGAIFYLIRRKLVTKVGYLRGDHTFATIYAVVEHARMYPQNARYEGSLLFRDSEGDW